jgi:formylglycine-generating enzyme
VTKMSFVTRSLLAAAVVIATAAALAVAQAPKPPRRVALLVGINEYKKRGFPNLKWAENDINEMARELRQIGFERVVTLTGATGGNLNPTKANIEAQLLKLLADADVGKDDVVLVMLSGHGQQLPVTRPDGKPGEDAFFCPADAVMNEPRTMISLSRMTDETLHKFGGKNIVIVDACRNGMVDRDRGAKGIDGRVVSLPEGTALLFSCAARQVSVERDDLKHGVFTYAMLETLRDPTGPGFLTWGALVDRVQNKVAELNPDQDPISATVIPRLVLATRIRSPLTAPAVNRPRPVDKPRASSMEGTRAGEERDDNDMKMTLCWCPAGKFQMGSPPGEPARSKDEGLVDVTLSRGFWLGKYEVTQAQWRNVMETTVREQKRKGGYGEITGEDPDHPVYFVNHDEATEFCRKWTESERAAGRLPGGWEYRLPTEAQWEYACRAGTTTATAFGSSLGSNQANFDGNDPFNGAGKGPYHKSTVPVGSYRANVWGLHDMHGNVWEWCRDFYAEALAGGRDPQGPSTATTRVIRGGGWCGTGWYCRSADRFRVAPGHRSSDLGFRVARVLSE